MFDSSIFCVCVCVCVRLCERAHARTCVCVRACMHARMRVRLCEHGQCKLARRPMHVPPAAGGVVSGVSSLTTAASTLQQEAALSAEGDAKLAVSRRKLQPSEAHKDSSVGQALAVVLEPAGMESVGWGQAVGPA